MSSPWKATHNLNIGEFKKEIFDGFGTYTMYSDKKHEGTSYTGTHIYFIHFLRLWDLYKVLIPDDFPHSFTA